MLFVVVSFISLSSCGDGDNDEPTPSQEDKITIDKIVGVWENGDYFISFSSDKFCTSFVNSGFLDSGNFQLSDGIVECVNSYFNHSTTYTINNVNDNTISIIVAYTDYYGREKTKNLSLTKTSEIPIDKDNPLVGKSYSGHSSYFGTITTEFTTYCSGKHTASEGNAKKYPLNIFYIYRDGKFYMQYFTNKSQQTPTIGGWSSNANTGKIYVNEVDFSSNGSISGVHTLKQIEYTDR